MEEAAVERYKLWPSRIDRPTYIKLIDPAATSLAKMQEDDGAVGFTRPAVNAHAYFEEMIQARIFDGEDLNEFRLEKLFEALKDKLAVVSIELEGGDDPQTIFETLNSRGEPLTASDLMRNFIFQRAVGLGQKDGSLVSDTLYEEHWLPLDRSYWRVQESRGRQLKPRLDWMLVDLLSAKQAALVSVEQLFSRYRSWIIEAEPYGGDIHAELQAITDAAAVSKAMFDQDPSDPLGRFGIFTNAFDVSTTTSLVVYLATEAELGEQLSNALKLLESYIVARDICKLTTANYNKFFLDCIAAVRRAEGDKIGALARYLTASTAITTRWPEDTELKHAWLNKPQYKPGKQARLRFILEAIESVMNAGADIKIKSGLTIEHIMPQTWRTTWPISPTPGIEPNDPDIELMQKEFTREAHVNVMGNLTLLTQPLNSEVSNGSFATKMPAVKHQSGLALNRELQTYDKWDEETITRRGLHMLAIAQTIWKRPARASSSGTDLYIT